MAKDLHAAEDRRQTILALRASVRYLMAEAKKVELFALLPTLAAAAEILEQELAQTP